MPRGGKRQTSFDSARAREAAAKSAKARRQKRAAPELELTDREQAKVALRRALDGNNMAAMVAAAKALIEFDRSPERGPVDTNDALGQLARMIERDRELRRLYAEGCLTCHGAGYVMKEECPTCRGRGYFMRPRRAGPGGRIGGEGLHQWTRGPEPERPSPEPPPVPPASVAGRPGGENPRLSHQATWNLRSRSLDGWGAPDGDDDPTA